jgi:siroheme synthase (precorrin-2 oxidase/ferrochelatase)
LIKGSQKESAYKLYMDLIWATHRSRTACAKAQAAKIIRAEIIAAKPRVGGQFVKETKRAGPSVRTPAERAEKREEVLQSKFDKYTVETRNSIAELKAQHDNAVRCEKAA